MTLTQAFYLFGLPVVIAFGGAAVAYWYGAKGDSEIRPGE